MIVAHIFAFIAIFAFMGFFLVIFTGSPEHKEYLVLLSAIAMLSCIIFVYLGKYADKLQLKWDSDKMSRLHNRRKNC